MTKQDYVDYMKKLGAKFEHQDADTICRLPNMTVVLENIPTTADLHVIDDFDFTPYTDEPVAQVVVSELRVGDRFVSTFGWTQEPIVKRF